MNVKNGISEQAADHVKRTCLHLLEYCKKREWAGYDPYDALNSRIFVRTPFYCSRIMRIGATQVLKRLPINLRPLLMIAPEQNPKALALFLTAVLKMGRTGMIEPNDPARSLVGQLIGLRSSGTPYWCWGYSFPWQTRTNLVPRGAPNLVCTTFVANALLDAYEQMGDDRCLEMAVSAGEYILNDLFWTDGNVASLRYPIPNVRSRVHNANLLGAALLSRIFRNNGDYRFKETAMRLSYYSAKKQREDGSWDYGELQTQRWVDNFHTGYNLCALRSIGRYLETSEFEQYVQRGHDFYLKNFFTEDNSPKYYHERTYPIDCHCVAQSIITLVELQDLDKGNIELALSVYRWAMHHLWDKNGFFYYQMTPWFTNRIAYMRWSQAWMLLSLNYLLEYTQE